VFVRLAREVIAAAPVDRALRQLRRRDLDGSVDRLVRFSRRSTKAHSASTAT
jgi:hypothetical protein